MAEPEDPPPPPAPLPTPPTLPTVPILRTNNLPRPPQQPTTSQKPLPPTLLHELISTKNWNAVIEACRFHPHEAGIGSSDEFRDERGYTALHSLLAYNRDVEGERLVPVVKALLEGAERVDFGGDYCLGSSDDAKYYGEDETGKDGVNMNFVNDAQYLLSMTIAASSAAATTTKSTTTTSKNNTIRKTGGAWRLLQDQKNRAKWSPFHLMCVQGGLPLGGLPLLKALLQIPENSDTTNNRSAMSCIQHYDVTNITKENENNMQQQQQQQHLLSLLDRQNRNVLHHLLESVVPSSQSFHIVTFLLEMHPSLLHQRDVRYKTPLMYVLERITESPGTRRRHFMESFGNDEEGLKKNYRMLRLLVGWMDRDGRKAGKSISDKEKDDEEEEEENTATSNHNESHSSEKTDAAENVADSKRNHPDLEVSSINVLHTACRLPMSISNGKLIPFMVSTKAATLESKLRNDTKNNNTVINNSTTSISTNTVNMAKEQDDNGNVALHILVSNPSYLHKASDNNNEISSLTSMRLLHNANPAAITTLNNDNQSPLKIAMTTIQTRNKDGISILAYLLMQYPQAIVLDPSLENSKLLIHLIGSVTDDKIIGGIISQLAKSQNQSESNKGKNDKGDDDTINHAKRLNAVYQLLKVRPDIFSARRLKQANEKASKMKKGEDGGEDKCNGTNNGKAKRWWGKFVPFL